MLYIWVTFLTRNDLLNQDKLPKELNSKELKKALNVLEVINLSDEEREEYENRLNWLRIEASAVKKMEAKTIEKIAKKMLIKKRPIEEIMEFTALPMK
ncbi:MAG TPA: Rpn family recombination-promoting nuclease/putative transposase [Rickettsia endosymbiont of Ceroptres masudai]|nr:Rpn family recombination-promoting nuclease/putative transposase [Rickettsia endosymbiont of Ceroptres masudai]